jgi:hypothetical protein
MTLKNERRSLANVLNLLYLDKENMEALILKEAFKIVQTCKYYRKLNKKGANYFFFNSKTLMKYS